MAITFRAFRLLLDVSRFFSNIRRDILGNFNSYEQRFANGDDPTDILRIAGLDAGNYQRLLGNVKARWDDVSEGPQLVEGLAAMGFDAGSLIDEFQELKAAADLQAAATTLQELNTAATTIRAGLDDFAPLI